MKSAPANLAALSLDVDGAQLFKGAGLPTLPMLRAVFADFPRNHAGVRVHGLAALSSALAVTGHLGVLASRVLGSRSRAVRAVLFDKTAETNWSLAWHQDRTICVKCRIETPAFGPWTIKNGMHHVAPPFDLLTRMVTLRAHLDDVPADNAPLLIAPGSHKEGRVPIDEIERIIGKYTVEACLAAAGDVWLYATPILHASASADNPGHRRVLQVDFAAEELSGKLEWLGV